MTPRSDTAWGAPKVPYNLLLQRYSKLYGTLQDTYSSGNLCPSCECVSIQDHRCYIQPVVEEQKDTEEEGKGSMVAPPPLFVYADFEAMQSAEGVFVANLLSFVCRRRDHPCVGRWGLCPAIYARSGWPGRRAGQWPRAWDYCGVSQLERVRWHVPLVRTLPATTGGGGPTDGGCQRAFFQEWTPQIHRLSVFLTHAPGGLPDHVQSDGIEEGVLSSPFNTPDHQQYVGWIPDLAFYDPDGMMAKKKQ